MEQQDNNCRVTADVTLELDDEGDWMFCLHSQALTTDVKSNGANSSKYSRMNNNEQSYYADIYSAIVESTTINNSDHQPTTPLTLEVIHR